VFLLGPLQICCTTLRISSLRILETIAAQVVVLPHRPHSGECGDVSVWMKCYHADHCDALLLCSFKIRVVDREHVFIDLHQLTKFLSLRSIQYIFVHCPSRDKVQLEHSGCWNAVQLFFVTLISSWIHSSKLWLTEALTRLTWCNRYGLRSQVRTILKLMS